MVGNKEYSSFNLNEVENNGYVVGYDKIVCPYCGAEHEYSSDDVEYAPFEDEEGYCEDCDKYFKLSAEPTFTFDFVSTPLEESD